MTVVRVEHDPASNLEDMIKIAQAAVESDKERLGALRAARQEVERAQTELDRRRRDVGQADRDDAKWHADWTDTLSRCWLGGADPEPSTAAARRILEDVAVLESTLENRASMADRIGRWSRIRLLLPPPCEASWSNWAIPSTPDRSSRSTTA